MDEKTEGFTAQGSQYEIRCVMDGEIGVSYKVLRDDKEVASGAWPMDAETRVPLTRGELVRSFMGMFGAI